MAKWSDAPVVETQKWQSAPVADEPSPGFADGFAHMFGEGPFEPGSGMFGMPEPSPLPPVDIGPMIEEYANASGIDRAELLTMAAGISPNDPRFKEKLHAKVTGRRYSGFFDEIGRAWTGFSEKLVAKGLDVAALTHPLRVGPMGLPLTPTERRGAKEDAESMKQMAAQLRQDAESERFQPGQEGGAAGFVAQVLGNVVPYAGVSMLAGLLAGPAGAFAVAATLEGDDVYRQALAKPGTSEAEALVAGTLGGTAIGLLEILQLNKLVKLGKGVAPAVRKELATEIGAGAMRKLAKGATVVGVEQTKTAVYEGFIETLQEWSGAGSLYFVTGKEPENMGERSLMSFAGGVVASILLSPVAIVLRGRAKGEGAAEMPMPDLVMTEAQHEQYERSLPKGPADMASGEAATEGIEQAEAQEREVPEAAGEGEAETPVAPEQTESVAVPDAQALWTRLNEETFAPSDAAETELAEAHREGLIQSPQDVAEWMAPGSTEVVTKEIRSPSAETPTLTGLTQELTTAYLHDIGRESENSHLRRSTREAMESLEAKQAMAAPDFYVDKVLKEGQSLTDKEEVGLGMRLTQLRLEQQSIRRQIAEAKDEPTKVFLDNEDARVAGLIQPIANALDIGGSEIARAMQIRKVLLNEQLESSYVKARSARKKGGPLTDQDNAKLDKSLAELDKARQIEELQRELDAVKAAQKAARKPVTRKRGDTRTREQRLVENMAKLKALLEAGC